MGVAARAPDGRVWTVRIVWWPRFRALGRQADASSFAPTPLYGSFRSGYAAYGGGGRFSGLGIVLVLPVCAAIAVAWPVVLLGKVVARGAWLVEATPENNLGVEGAAWRVRGLGRAKAAVESVASAIQQGNPRPHPEGARAVEFDRRPPKSVPRL